MEFKAHTNDAEFRSLMQRLRNAGSKANTAMKTSMRRSTKPIVNEWKAEAELHKRTGATKRSLGTMTLKDGIKIGVRYNYKDNKTGKIPNLYAAKIVISKQGDWFGKIWDRHKHGLTMRVFGEVKMLLNKKGF